MKKIITILFIVLINAFAVYAQWKNTGLYGGNVTAFVVNGNNIFVGTEGRHGVYLSTNNGTNWSESSLGLPENAQISAMAVCNNNIFVSVQSSTYSLTGVYGVYMSNNNGANWVLANTGLSTGNTILYVTSFAVVGNNIFAATFNGVYLSNNNGSSWSGINNGLPTIAAVMGWDVVIFV